MTMTSNLNLRISSWKEESLSSKILILRYIYHFFPTVSGRVRDAVAGEKKTYIHKSTAMLNGSALYSGNRKKANAYKFLSLFLPFSHFRETSEEIGHPRGSHIADLLSSARLQHRPKSRVRQTCITIHFSNDLSMERTSVSGQIQREIAKVI